MPIIEVGEFDRVFIVRCKEARGRKSFQPVELGDSDLVVTIQEQWANHPETGELVHCTPKTRVLIGGDQIGLLKKFRIEANSDNPLPIMEFSITSPEAEFPDDVKVTITRNLNQLKKLLPLATIHEMGLKGEVLHEHGRDV